MAFYEDKILPWLLDVACSVKPVMKQRRRIVPRATGEVLEVGMGSGLNLSYYDPEKVSCVWGLEPSEGMRLKAKANLQTSPVEVKWLDLPGEAIPLEDDSIDTVLLTFTLCTIPDWNSALTQMHRVLKPGGQLLFCEHGRSPDTSTVKWQDRLTPLWRKFAGGCHLNRPIADYLEKSGFKLDERENFYMPKTPRFLGYMYFGRAVKA